MELGPYPTGVDRASYSFTTPFRDADKDYWDYRFGIVIPVQTTFSLSGELAVYSKSGAQISSNPINSDSVTKSSWLMEDDRVSYLVNGEVGLEDGENYSLDLKFDPRTNIEVAVVLHYLSHER